MEELFQKYLADEQVISLARLAYVVGVAVLLHFVVRLWLIKLFNKLYYRSKQRWYQLMVDHKVIHRALFLLPLLVLQVGLEWVAIFPEDLTAFVIRIINAMMIVVVARTLDAVLESLHSGYYEFTPDEKRPIRGYVQIGKVVIYIFVAILVIAQLADRSPWYFLSGLGALTAIFLLVFRDTLLSMVASVQLTGNNLIQIDDWIEMPQFDADGPVIDMTLNTVQVQNFDKTVTSIPTHKFLEHSFRNYRSMQESGGRRIKRSVYLDITSVRFLYLNEVERYRQSGYLKDYIERKLIEITEYHNQVEGGIHSPLDSRWLTNLGTFRAYIMAYLDAHQRINHGMTKMVRQLEPTSEGLPLEVYAFTNDTRWIMYEQIQSDIFDHIFAVSSEFDLRIYQKPSGYDFRGLHQRS